MTKLLVRRAVDKDIPPIRRIMKLLMHPKIDFGDAYFHPTRSVRWFVDRGEYFVVTEDGRVIGAMVLEDEDKGLGITILAVTKSRQKSGGGKKLVDYAKEMARKTPKSRLSVCSFYVMKAKDFYLKQGFKLMEPWCYGRLSVHRFEMDV